MIIDVKHIKDIGASKLKCPVCGEIMEISSHCRVFSHSENLTFDCLNCEATLKLTMISVKS